MAVCKFWLRGSCRNGANCKFQHPPQEGQRGSITTGNRFGALQNQSNSPNQNGYQAGPSPAQSRRPYHLSHDAMWSDLFKEKPPWILSAYTPFRDTPAQLFGGPLREQSFEEMRLRHYIAKASGNEQQARQEADRLYNESQQQIQIALDDLDGAIRFILKAENEHPNRFDICKASQSGSLSNGSGSTAFGQPSGGSQAAPAADSPFGRPAATSTFGAPSVPAASGAFGQPSVMGQKPNPFGAPSQAFGAPSVPPTNGAFGQPSALGQKPNPFGAPFHAFGAPSQQGNASGFGQNSVLGQKANPFGNPPSGQVFGAASNVAAPSSFASLAQQSGQQTQTPSPFGAVSQAQASPFGQPSGQAPNPFGSANTGARPNPFGSASNGSSLPFGAPSPTQKSVFGAQNNPSVSAPNPFSPARTISLTTGPSPTEGSFMTPPSALGAQPIPSPSGSYDAAAFAAETANSNPYGGFSQQTNNGAVAGNGPGNSAPQQVNGLSGIGPHPSLSSYTSQASNGQLTMFKGMPVRYQNGQAGCMTRDGRWRKIWYPTGPPAVDKNTEMEDEAYDDDTKEMYGRFVQSGQFQEGVMPMLPPKRDWCRWDF